jgi:hypothetical protein
MNNYMLQHALSEITPECDCKTLVVSKLEELFRNIKLPFYILDLIKNITLFISSRLLKYYNITTLVIFSNYLDKYIIPLCILFNITIDVILPPSEYTETVSTISFCPNETLDSKCITTIITSYDNNPASMNFNYDKYILEGYRYYINDLFKRFLMDNKFNNIKYYFSI